MAGGQSSLGRELLAESMSMGSTSRMEFALSTPMSMERKSEEKPRGVELLKEDERADERSAGKLESIVPPK